MSSSLAAATGAHRSSILSTKIVLYFLIFVRFIILFLYYFAVPLGRKKGFIVFLIPKITIIRNITAS